jgi:hypothetical protein
VATDHVLVEKLPAVRPALDLRAATLAMLGQIRGELLERDHMELVARILEARP